MLLSIFVDRNKNTTIEEPSRCVDELLRLLLPAAGGGCTELHRLLPGGSELLRAPLRLFRIALEVQTAAGEAA